MAISVEVIYDLMDAEEREYEVAELVGDVDAMEESLHRFQLASELLATYNSRSVDALPISSFL